MMWSLSPIFSNAPDILPPTANDDAMQVRLRSPDGRAARTRSAVRRNRSLVGVTVRVTHVTSRFAAVVVLSREVP